MKKLNGVVTALMTATDGDGTPDLEGTLALAKYCADGGVNGLFVSGTNGEGLNFSVEQRIEIARYILDHLDRSGVMVCIHSGASRLEETIELTQAVHRMGADCAAVITPAFIPYDDDALYDYYKKVSKSVPDDFPLYVYNIPPRTGNDISPSLVRRLFEDCPNIVGIKASYCDLGRTLDYLDIPGISMLQGSDVYQLAFLATGCDGIISGLSGVYPTPFVKVRESWLVGDIEMARKWQSICYQVCQVLNCGHIPTMKRAMELKGFSLSAESQSHCCNDKLLAEQLELLDNLIAKQSKPSLMVV